MTGDQKRFLVFCTHFKHFEKTSVLCRAKGDKKKFPQIPAYSGLCGVVRNACLTEEGYAEFSECVTLCKMSQSEYIRQALIKSSIRQVITVSPVDDELLSAVGKLKAVESALREKNVHGAV